MRTIKGMKNIGTDYIWLRGSRQYIRRSVYQTPGGDGEATFWVIFGGQPIRVLRGSMEYYTVDMY